MCERESFQCGLLCYKSLDKWVAELCSVQKKLLPKKSHLCNKSKFPCYYRITAQLWLICFRQKVSCMVSVVLYGTGFPCVIRPNHVDPLQVS